MHYDEFFPSKIREIPLSGIREVLAWPSSIPDNEQIKLNIGQPDLEVPKFIKEAVTNALKNNFTSYTPILGYISLRKLISEYLDSYCSIKYNPVDEILVTSGGQSALFSIFRSILDSDSSIIIPFPSYPEYVRGASYNDATMVPLPTSFEDDFSLMLDKVDFSKINTKRKFLIICSPNNPTGATITDKDLSRIEEIAVENNMIIISDEIYDRIYYQDDEYRSIAAYSEELKERTITIKSLSKTFAMTGLRIGFIAAPKPMIDQFKKMHHSMNICASSISQMAAKEAFENKKLREENIQQMVAIYQERRDYCLSRLSKIPELEYKIPPGAFYIFPKLKFTNNSIGFCKFLKEKYGVLCVPGAYFSLPGICDYSEFIRLSYAASMDDLTKGFDKLELAIKNYKE